MKRFHKLICHLLIATMLVLPFSANAGMVGTDEAVMGARELANRDTVREFIAREDVSNQLQTLGVSPTSAQARVAAMTGDEVNQLAGHIDSMPAGGLAQDVVLAIVIALVAFLLWYFSKDREAAK